jgi:hypothetical protein
MERLEKMLLALRANVADQYEKRKVATIRYKGQKGKAELEITKTQIAIYLSEGDDDTPTEHIILFSAASTILDMFIQFLDIDGIEMILDPHTAPSYNVSSLFYQKRTTIIFDDDKEAEENDDSTIGLEIFLSSFYSDDVYIGAIEDAINIIREGSSIDELEEGDLVYVKWLASSDLCKKRAAALTESISKLQDIDRETVSLGGKISVSSDTGQSSDVQAIARQWLTLADKYADLCKSFLEDASAAMPEVVVGNKIFEDSLTGEQFPLVNIDLKKKIRNFTSQRVGDDLILTWDKVVGKDFKEYRIYGHSEDFYVPMDISAISEDITLVTTLTKPHFPEYIYEDYYTASNPPSTFYIVCVTTTDLNKKSDKLEITIE